MSRWRTDSDDDTPAPAGKVAPGSSGSSGSSVSAGPGAGSAERKAGSRRKSVGPLAAALAPLKQAMVAEAKAAEVKAAEARAANQTRGLAGRPAARPGVARGGAGSLANGPQLSDEDLFLREVSGAVPIPRSTGRAGAPPPPPPRPAPNRQSEENEVMAALSDLCRGDGPIDIADTDEFIEGLAEGVDRRLLKKLRAGEFAVQAHVDLHGLTRDEARDAVVRFLVASRRAGHRCVLIVTGRGLHSKDSIPVLKQSVRTWLERGHTAAHVLAFATARPHDGGAGAVYVLLRR